MKRIYKLVALIALFICGISNVAAQNEYYFKCPADVLEFTGIAGISASYADGLYTVSPIPSGETARYSYLTLKVKEEYASSYTLEGVSFEGGTLDPYNNEVSIGVYYYPAPVTWTVNFEGMGDTERKGWFFQGPAGLLFKYSYNNNTSYRYADGGYLIDDLEPYSSTITVMVNTGYNRVYEIVNITDEEAGTVYEASNGVVTVPVTNLTYNQNKNFIVNTKDFEAGETITFTAELMNGNAYQATIFVGNTEYDFYTNPRSITVDNANDVIFINTGLTGEEPYSVTIDGVQLPSSLWDFNTDYNLYGFTIAPGSEYYPENGGSLKIYLENPVQRDNLVTFSFVNEGTSSFLSNLQVGYSYLRGEEFEEAIADGLELKSGTGLSLGFNLTDYDVQTITLNGEQLIDYANGYATTVNGDLAFVFDVKRKPGNVVHFTVPGNYEGVLIYDRNDPENAITLPSGNCDVEFQRVVEEIKIVAAEGYVMSQEETSKPITVTVGDTEESYFGGSYFNIVDGMNVNIVISKAVDPSQKVFTFYCSADVIEFSGVTLEGEESNPQVSYTAPQGDSRGYYTVTHLPNSLYGVVMEQYRAEYVIDYLEYAGERMTSPTGYNFGVNTSRINGNAEFDIVFKTEAEPARYITIEVNNPSCIKRMYNGNSGNITSFPAQYDLNDGLTLTIETAADCKVTGVTCNGTNLLVSNNGDTALISFEGVEEGDVVKVNASVIAADFSYTFEAPEGLSIVYNGINAEYYSNGQYKVNNVRSETLGQYPVIISVAEGYENRLSLVDVTYGQQTWQPAGASGIINIPGSDLPANDATFVVNTEVPEVSETTRTITMTIDDVNAISYGVYQGGSSSYFGFDANGETQLTITPQQYMVQIVTFKAINKITTDVENTFDMPTLPSTSVVLNLQNVVEGQTINLITATEESYVSGINVDGDNIEIYTLQGTKVAGNANFHPGIYIVNGKKLIVK